MTLLDEKKALLQLSQALGLPVDPKLAEEIAYLEEKEKVKQARLDRVKKNVQQDTQAFHQANPISIVKPERLKEQVPKDPFKELKELFAALGEKQAKVKPKEEPPKEYKRLDHYPDGKPIPKELPDLYQSVKNEMVPSGQNCHNCYYMQDNGGCSKWGGAQVRADYWCAKWNKQEKKAVKEQTAANQIADYITETVVSQGEPVLAQPTNNLELKVKQLEKWISKIAATGPGGGEVNLRWLDDIDRPTIYDQRYLRYNDTKKKFEFAEVNPHDIVYTTTLVTTPTYTATDSDYYIGVNYAGAVTITLPAPSSGRMLIIKDESGNASTNPITVNGTVDNDTGGFIIQLDNGAIQLIYRNGWRIV